MSSVPAVSTPTVTNQQFFIEKSQKLVLDTTRIALETLILHSKTSARNFYDTVIQPKQNEISELDKRTKTFFEKMMIPVTQGFSVMKAFDPSFMMFEHALGIPNIKAKFLEAIALDPIRNLMTELDERSPTIVDDVITS